MKQYNGRCFGVLGDPIGHSRSPIMHNVAFETMNLPHRYFPFHVKDDELANALRGAKALGMGGLNLTVPHKQAALPCMDHLTEEAKRIGAVNTVIFQNHQLIGHNTDGQGFRAALHQLVTESPKTHKSIIQHAVVLGAGGVSRAILDSLVHDSQISTIVWVSRIPEQLPQLSAKVIASSYEELLQHVQKPPDLLVNCTTIGMEGGPTWFPFGFDLERLGAPLYVVDMVYPRLSGGLLDRAEMLGSIVQGGLPTLFWQGVFALEAWLGLKLTVEVRQAMWNSLSYM